MIDVVVIGAGVTGCAIARELSRLRLSVAVYERGEDVCSGTSKANSAIIHSGHSAAPGSRMARMNVLGNAMYSEICEELDVPLKRIGSLNVAFSPEQLSGLEKLMADGKANGVPHEDGFDITVASEVMAVFCLATDLKDPSKLIAEPSGMLP